MQLALLLLRLPSYVQGSAGQPWYAPLTMHTLCNPCKEKLATYPHALVLAPSMTLVRTAIALPVLQG